MSEASKTSYERLISGGYGAAYAANLARAAYAARLSFSAGDPQATIVSNVGANVAGPFLLGYVLWVVLHAHATGKRRLYFLARDGQILSAIADRVVARFDLDLDCRYLYASRQAWHLPSLLEMDEHAREWIFGVPPVGAIEQVFARLELEPMLFQQVLADIGFPRSEWMSALDLRQRDCLFAALKTEPFAAAISIRSFERRAATLAFLRSQGLFDGTSAAIVDVGWSGRLQKSLARLCRAEPGCDQLPTGYYVGLNGSLDAERYGSSYAFISTARTVNAVLIESLCAASHGSVRSFRIDQNGVAVADLRTPYNAAALHWGLATFQAAILAFVDRTLADPLTVDASRLQLAASSGGMRVLQRFTHWPSYAEADCFGRFPHTELQEHIVSSDIAPPFDVMGKLREIFSGRKLRSPYYWVEGSLRRTFPPIVLCMYRVWRVFVERAMLTATVLNFK